MKKIASFIACMCLFVMAHAQTFRAQTPPPPAAGPTRGTMGTIQAFTSYPGQICAVVVNTVTPVAAGKLDTLVDVDTGYVQWTSANNLARMFEFSFTRISGTAAGTAILQCSKDGTEWKTVTGNTTYVATSGASATITGSGTTKYQWNVPAGVLAYPFWQIRAITSGTVTGSYAATMNYEY